MMLTRTLSIVAAVVAVAHVSAAAPPVRKMYTDALAKEQAVRKALADPQATDLVLKAVHECVATYEAVVRHYPASSYSDDALFNAGRLEVDAFVKFGQPADKDLAGRLLKRLELNYPSSKLVKRVPTELARADQAVASPRAAPSPVPSPPSPSSTPPSSSTSSPPSTPSPRGASLPPRSNGQVAVITAIRRSVLSDAVRVTIELDAEVLFRDERITGPDRVFVDLPATRAAQSLLDRTLRFDSDGEPVRQVRIGRHPNNVTRVVLDTTGVSSYSVYPLYSPFRLVIDCVRSLAAQPTPAAMPLPSRRLTLNLKRAPIATPTARLAIAEARAELIEPLPMSAPSWAAAKPPLEISGNPGTPASVESPVNTPPLGTPGNLGNPGGLPNPLTLTAPGNPASGLPLPRNLGGVSIARQLGLGVSRIVIDAGHGGHDPGAQGKGVTEAELVLDVTLRLEKLLLATPGVDVILTRRTDDFVPLQDRTAIANREGADLFLSIHANASPSPQARGIETYFLNFANNLSAAAVAARENAASGQTMGSLPDYVKAIALNNKLDESKNFAQVVQRSLVEKFHASNRSIKDLGVKQAPFVVLIGAAMPSVLAEISFVTNPQDARLLKGSAYRQKIAEALFAAIRKYQSSLKSVQTEAYK